MSETNVRCTMLDGSIRFVTLRDDQNLVSYTDRDWRTGIDLLGYWASPDSQRIVRGTYSRWQDRQGTHYIEVGIDQVDDRYFVNACNALNIQPEVL